MCGFSSLVSRRVLRLLGAMGSRRNGFIQDLRSSEQKESQPPRLAMELGQREEGMERVWQTVGALWRAICCSAGRHILALLEEPLMKTLDLREYMQAAINVDEVAMGR